MGGGEGASNDRMDALIQVINKLQDVFNTVGEAKVRREYGGMFREEIIYLCILSASCYFYE